MMKKIGSLSGCLAAYLFVLTNVSPASAHEDREPGFNGWLSHNFEHHTLKTLAACALIAFIIYIVVKSSKRSGKDSGGCGGGWGGCSGGGSSGCSGCGGGD